MNVQITNLHFCKLLILKLFYHVTPLHLDILPPHAQTGPTLLPDPLTFATPAEISRERKYRAFYQRRVDNLACVVCFAPNSGFGPGASSIWRRWQPYIQTFKLPAKPRAIAFSCLPPFRSKVLPLLAASAAAASLGP